MRMPNLANSQLNRKVKMSLIASIYLNEFSLAECRACYKFLVLPFIATAAAAGAGWCCSFLVVVALA